MMKRSLFLLALAAAFMASCQKNLPAPEAGSDDAMPAEESASVIPGQAIIYISEELNAVVEQDFSNGVVKSTKSAAINDAFSELDIVRIERVYEDGGEWEPRHRAAGLHRWYRVFYGPHTSLTKAGKTLMDVEGVESYTVERKTKLYSTDIFNDPYLYKQWHYYCDINNNMYKAGADINVLPVWQRGIGGSANVIVSIQDGGIDTEHPDLAPVVLPYGKGGSKNFMGKNSISAHNHGTHVGGTVGAINNNGIGVSGIAGGLDGNGGVMLMSCQVFDNESKYGGDMYNAMVWAADNGAVISQNSWGDVYDTKEEAAAGGVGAMKGAIDYFIKNAGCDVQGNQRPDSPMKGGLVFFAAGNETWPDGWPAEYSAKEPLCISVGAVSSLNTRAYYSNYGDWVTIAAPGGDAQIGATIYSTLPGASYGTMQGTSMACPHASGVAALILSYCGGPGFTNAMLREKLVETARYDVLPANSKIGGLIDAFGALTYGEGIAPDMVKAYTVEAKSNNLDFTFKVTADKDDGKAYGYLLLASKDQDLLKNIRNFASLPQGVLSADVLTGELEVGENITGSLPKLDFETEYYVTVVAFDYGRNFSAASDIKKTSTLANNAPVVETSYIGDYRIRSYQVADIVYSVYDPDGHAVSVSFSTTYPDKTVVKGYYRQDEGVYTVTLDSPNAVPGKYQYTITAKDAYGMTTVIKQDFEFMENQAPVIVKKFDDVICHGIGSKLSFVLDNYFSDPDGESLAYSAKTDVKAIHAVISQGVMNVTSIDYGMSNLTVTATDAKGLNVSGTVRILVVDDSNPVQITPDDNSQVFTVTTTDPAETYIRVVSVTGQIVYEKTAVVSGFEPAIVDLTACAPGYYDFTVKYGSVTVEKKILKL